jgi:hypothetical protein
MTPRIKEESNETYLKRRMKETGGETRKVKWVGRRGAPDRLVGWKTLGRYAFVELKEESQPWGLQDHQRREIEWMKACGLRVAILSNKAEIDQFIEFQGYEP